jgi:hypothetical protein
LLSQPAKYAAWFSITTGEIPASPQKKADLISAQSSSLEYVAEPNGAASCCAEASSGAESMQRAGGGTDTAGCGTDAVSNRNHLEFSALS